MTPTSAHQPSGSPAPKRDQTPLSGPAGAALDVPTLGELVRTTFHLGAVGYGGPAILALMKQSLVTKKKWITEKDFMDAVSLAQALPGATGVTVLGYVGFKLKKIWGGVLAPLGFLTPPTLLMIALSWAYFTYGQLPFVKSLFAGLGALVVALLLNACIVLGRAVFPKLSWDDWRAAVIAGAGFTGVYLLHLNVLWIVLGTGLLGLLLYFPPGRSRTAPAVDIPVHVEPERLPARAFLPAVLVAAVVVASLLAPYSRQLMATFLGIGAAAFGGGFGSIPLIHAQVVDAHGWLTTKEFVDGIALGQITPGPVFITATFIGYRVAGVIGAIIATLGVFIPSVTAIILLANLHARIQNHPATRAIIKGLQAGFIGLILSVTLQFAYKSLLSWPEWLIFIATFIYVGPLKKNSLWAILATIGISLLFL
jgi:chromate transporter